IVGKQPPYKLLNPDRLLNLLSSNYQKLKTGVKVSGTVSSIKTILPLIKDAADKESFYVAGFDPSIYTIFPSSSRKITIYTTSLDSVLRKMIIDTKDKFPNIEVVETPDTTTFFDCRTISDFNWLSPLQVYLELANSGKREQDAAEQIREDL